MKIVKDAKHEYEKNNVNEVNGYTKWYDCGKITIIRIVAVIFVLSGLLCFLYTPAFEKFSHEFKAPQGAPEELLFIAAGALIMIVMVPLLWRVIQLALVSDGKLNKDCSLKLGFSLTCIYNKNLSRKKAVWSLIIPLILFVILFSLLTVLTDGVYKTFFLLILYRTGLFAVDDIGALLCLFKNVGKNDVVFGEYKKTVL